MTPRIVVFADEQPLHLVLLVLALLRSTSSSPSTGPGAGGATTSTTLSWKGSSRSTLTVGLHCIRRGGASVGLT